MRLRSYLLHVATLSDSERQTLTAVCDALVPAYDDERPFFATGALAAGVPERVERLVGMLTDPHDRARLRLLLRVLGSRLASLVSIRRPSRFHGLPPEQRERLLATWAESSWRLPRTGFQALKRLVHVAYYCWPPRSGPHPAWPLVGYPGPLPQPEHGVAPLAAQTVDHDATIDCDVVVIGSGAGGGVVAGVLADLGRDVVILEQGPNPGAADMTQVEGDMLASLYLEHGLLMTQSGSMPVLAGSCVGGGTLINYTTSLPLPDAIRQSWDASSGLDLFSGSTFVEAVERVSARLDVNRLSSPGIRDQLLEQGCERLGWHVDAIPRNVTNCLEGAECGFCGYGCRHGAKNSTAVTYLADAVACGARLYPHCTVERIVIEAGVATGVRATVQHGDRPASLTVRAKRVVVAAGSIGTPALLLRSGVSNANIGRNLYLHPATAMTGVFNERVDPWTGSLQTRYSDEMGNLDAGFGTRFETAPVQFALVASGFGWGGSRAYREDVAKLGNMGLVGVLLRDRFTGRVKVTRSGHPKVHYDLSPYDARHARAGLMGAAKILAAAGAKEITSLHTPPARVTVRGDAWEDELQAAMDARGYRRSRMSYVSFHQMGTAAMGRDRRKAVVDEHGASHDVRHLYVADASTFPASSGVNPMLTIMAIADHVARRIHDRW